MLTNYFKLALRNVSRQKSFTVLNVLGLAIGIAAILLLFHIVQYEWSFNTNFKNYDRIVRVVTTSTGPDGSQGFHSGMSTSAMIAVQNTVPQLAASSRIREYWPTVIVPDPSGGAALKKLTVGPNQVCFFAEPGFFRVFDFQWLAGDQATVLNEPNSVVFTRSMAEKCFDRWEKALGQTVLLDNAPMVIRGIMSDPPSNCDLPVQLVISYATLLADQEKYDYVENWGRNRTTDQLYGLLGAPDQFAAANANVLQVGKKEYAADATKNQVGSMSHFLQPISDLHFDARFSTSGRLGMEKSRLWVLSSIGLLVLIMACFNFINLSTAQALRRSKEVGVRKTLGGSRSVLFGQFMSETALIVLFSVCIGTLLAWMASPLLKHISEVPDAMSLLNNVLVWRFLGALTLVVTFLSGFYPALILTGFNPVRALKNNISSRNLGGASVRKGLVVLQFAIAQVLILGTIVTLGQMNYIRHMDLGFSKDLIYNFRIDGDSLSRSKMNSMKERLMQIPGVESVSLNSQPPASGGSWQTNFTVGRGNEDPNFNTCYKFCDADFQKTYGLQMLAGHWFGPSNTTTGYVINETLMKKVGIKSPEEAIGKELRLEREPWYPIVGVVRDFHSKSARSGIEPLTIASGIDYYTGAGVKISPANMGATTAAIQRIFDDTYPEQVFDAQFFDESIARFYTAENRFSDICKGSAFLAILIACLGLFGLAAHAAQQRNKEVGIRKVLGSSVAGIMGLLAKDFLQLVVIAIVLASPFAWYFMDKWLANFTYHVDIQWWMFVIAGLGALAVAFLTVGFQSVKTALANPVKSLRSE